jgi:hypothetical protein
MEDVGKTDGYRMVGQPLEPLTNAPVSPRRLPGLVGMLVTVTEFLVQAVAYAAGYVA